MWYEGSQPSIAQVTNQQPMMAEAAIATTHSIPLHTTEGLSGSQLAENSMIPPDLKKKKGVSQNLAGQSQSKYTSAVVKSKEQFSKIAIKKVASS